MHRCTSVYCCQNQTHLYKKLFNRRGTSVPLPFSRRANMPVKKTIVGEGTDYPLVKQKAWFDFSEFDNTNLAKGEITANTETSFTVVKYFADEDAYSAYYTDNSTLLQAISTMRAANSITTTFSSEDVDTIPD